MTEEENVPIESQEPEAPAEGLETAAEMAAPDEADAAGAVEPDAGSEAAPAAGPAGAPEAVAPAAPPAPPAAAPIAPPPPPVAPSAPQAPAPQAVASDKNRVAAGVLGILLGGLGVHKFYLGYQKEGIIMAAVWLVGWVTFGFASGVVAIVGLIEGIIYLTKTDEEFVATYVNGQKPWF